MNAALLFDYQPVHWIPNWIGTTFSLTIRPPRMNAPIAVFGLCRSLTLRFDQPLPKSCTVWAQCLLDEDAADVTGQVELRENTLRVDGRLLRLWGHDPKAPCAVHEPAVLLRIAPQA